jgi:hypothetical protein
MLDYVPDMILEEGGTSEPAMELEHALACCWDLPALQTSSLTQMPAVVERANHETEGLELAKALRKELIDCAGQLTQRVVYPIADILNAIENGRMGTASQALARVKREIGLPFSRTKVDLARYYAIRLAMEGVNHQSIADFLEVDPRTVSNYLVQARDRIGVVLESQAMLDKAFGMQTRS